MLTFVVELLLFSLKKLSKHEKEKNIDKFENTSINVECYDLIYNNKIEFIKMTKAYRIYAQCTLVGLSTRPNPLIISKYLQFRTFWSQSKALFMIRCMLSVKSWFKTVRVQKWPYWVQIFEFLLHKITNFRHISACQWTLPSCLFAKKNHTKIFCSC